MNAGLTEAVAGIEVVKGFAQEPEEERRFSVQSRLFRDSFVEQGRVEARSLPLLVYGIAIGVAFGHALFLFLNNQLTVGQVITFMALLNNLRMPMRFLLMIFSIIQQAIASARRVLSLITTETELDENANGVAQSDRRRYRVRACIVRLHRRNARRGTSSHDERAAVQPCAERYLLPCATRPDRRDRRSNRIR